MDVDSKNDKSRNILTKIKKMKNIIRVSLILIPLSLSLISCNDDLNKGGFSDSSNLEEISLQDKRMTFSSRDELKQKVDKIKKLDANEKARFLGEHYDKGFIPMRPFILIEDEKRQDMLIARLNEEHNILSTRAGGDDEVWEDEMEEIISDDDFASILNSKGEVVVNDSIYKYTREGLFIVHKAKQQNLYDYLSEVHVTNNEGSFLNKNGVATRSNNNIYTRSLPAKIYDCDRSETILIDEERDIYHYRSLCGDNNYGGGSSVPPAPPRNILKEIDTKIKNLKECNSHSSTIPWFGKSAICTDKFDRKHRIKTKFWSHNYGIYASIGCLTKTQRRRFRIWWASKADDLVLGVNKAVYRYNLPANQTYKSFLDEVKSGEIYASAPSLAAITKEGYAFTPDGNGFWNFKGGSKYYPEFPFTKTDPIFRVFISMPNNKYLSKIPWLGNLEIDKQFNGKFLNDIFWDNVIDKVKDLVPSYLAKINKSDMPKAPISIEVLDPFNNIYYVTIIEYVHRKNENKIEKTWDYSIGEFSLNLNGFASGLNLTNAVSVVPKFNAMGYDALEIDMYGVGRRGNTWRGSRIIKKF